MKYIYLDQMAWIELAKRVKSNQHSLDFLKNLVESKKIIFPLSLTHFIETNKSPRLDQRELLSILMINLSKGLYISCNKRHSVDELENAYIDLLKLNAEKNEIKIFTQDVFDIFDKRLLDHIENFGAHSEIVKSIFSSPTGIFGILSASDESIRENYLKKYYSFTRQVKVDDQKFLKKIKDSSKEEIKRIYAAKLMVELLDEINLMIDKYPSKKLNFFNFTPLEGMKLINSTPTLHTEMELRVLRDIQWTREISENDLDDLAFLRVAIPYCDYVVTEKFWAHLSAQSKLDKKYKTKFFNNIDQLEQEINGLAL